MKLQPGDYGELLKALKKVSRWWLHMMYVSLLSVFIPFT
jgi:hypothetical protein